METTQICASLAETPAFDESLQLAELPSELLEKIFGLLEPATLLAVELVCWRFHTVVRCGTLWKTKSFERWRQLKALDPVDWSHWKLLYFYQPLLKRHGLHPQSIIVEPLVASSTDFPEQGIENTLLWDSDDKYWSSRGSADVNSNESLSYLLGPDACLVSSVSLAVYRAHWQPDRPIYAPRAARLLFGLVPDSVTDIIDMPIGKHIHVQKFQLPYPVVAKWVTLQLLGRTQTQPYDELWYTVLSKVRCDGWPLSSILHTPIGQALAKGISRQLNTP